MNKEPSISIITSTYNCKDQLVHTIESVRNQNYKNIQWIIQDGGSTDGTIELVSQNIDIISVFNSSRDRGIYDAWNRACEFISGDWVLFLGAGDMFFTNNSLRDFWKYAFDDERLNEYRLVYGIVKSVSPTKNYFRFSKQTDLSKWEFGRPCLPHHQGVFHHSTCFSGINTFDSTLTLAGDSKFLLQIINKYGRESVGFFPVRLSVMVLDGLSNNPRSILLARREISRILKELTIRRSLGVKFRFLLMDYLTLIWSYLIPNPLKNWIRPK